MDGDPLGRPMKRRQMLPHATPLQCVFCMEEFVGDCNGRGPQQTASLHTQGGPLAAVWLQGHSTSMLEFSKFWRYSSGR
jgi:hypothetical protein